MALFSVGDKVTIVWPVNPTSSDHRIGTLSRSGTAEGEIEKVWDGDPWHNGDQMYYVRFLSEFAGHWNCPQRWLEPKKGPW